MGVMPYKVAEQRVKSLIDEKQQLVSKITKLIDFCGTDAYLTLLPEETYLLDEQLIGMQRYKDSLALRIIVFKSRHMSGAR